MRDDFLGETHQQKFPAIYIWLGGDQEGFTEESWATHYDARLNNPDRSPNGGSTTPPTPSRRP